MHGRINLLWSLQQTNLKGVSGIMTVDFIVDNNTSIETLSTFVKSYKKTATVKAFQVKTNFLVKTLEGTMKGNAGDYLCQGIDGEKWPVKKEVFEKTYEVVI